MGPSPKVNVTIAVEEAPIGMEPGPEASIDHVAQPRYCKFAGVQHLIEDGDLLLKRAGFLSLIASAGRTPYCHAGMAAWWNGKLMLVEMVEWIGGRAVPLAKRVEALPGRWDVFKANPDGLHEFNGYWAVQAMIDLIDTNYGWWNLAKAALAHLPIVRLFVRPRTNDGENGSPPFCSQAVSRANRCGGVDPVLLLADGGTEPGDLARSPFYRYLFTLIP